MRKPWQHTSETRLRGRAAQERRRRLLERNPLCVRCLEKGVTRPVDQFDHIVPLGKKGPDTEENMEGLCLEHHKEKTLRDRGIKPRPRIGADGWTIE